MDKCLCSICSGETKIKKIDIDQAHAFLRPIQEQYEAELAALKTQLAEKDKRLATAEGLLQRWLKKLSMDNKTDLRLDTEVFLTPTSPATNPVLPEGMVLVRREDWEKAIDFMEHTAGIYWSEIKDRLKAALERQPLCSCQSKENYDPFCPTHGTQELPL